MTYEQPVAFCTDPYTSKNLPWYTIYVTSHNIRNGKATRPPVPKALLLMTDCYGPGICTASVHTEYTGSDIASFKLVPTHDKYGNKIIFELYSLKYGRIENIKKIYKYVPFYAPLVVGYTLTSTNEDLKLVGITFDGVTEATPNLYPNKMMKFQFVCRYQDSSTPFSQNPNVPHKNESSACDYIFGWQPLLDPNDNPTLEIVSQDPYRADSYITSPDFDKLGELSCIKQSCTTNEAYPSACREFINRNPDPTIIKALLGDRCSSGNFNSLSPECQIWCRLGIGSDVQQPDDIVREQCIASRKKLCTTYFDPITNDFFRLDTPQLIKDNCSCFMPQDYYNLISEGRAKSSYNPQCFFQQCAKSDLGKDTYKPTNCADVKFCVQEGGITNESCIINAAVTTTATTNTGWLNIILIIIIVLVIAVVLIIAAYHVYAKQKPKVVTNPTSIT